MSWTREFNLYLNVALEPGKILLRDKNGQAAATRPEWVSADTFPVNLWLLRPATTTGEAPAIETLEPGDQMILSGKATPAGALLFSATGWALVENEATGSYYTTILDLNTSALEIALGTQSSLIITGEIEIQNPQNTRRISAQFQVLIRRQIYAGEGTPQPAPPAYPLPGALLTLDQLPAALAAANPIRAGRVAIPAAAETVAVQFPAPFQPGTTPHVVSTVTKPSAGDRIWANPIEETITHEGFTAELSGPPGSSGLHLTYIAIAPAA
ncbi:hypothetical protein [Geminisphaera colitermitum]|uniref:hypothetical protein n=1 Tax=Geminisphaera colitermitum TaxID=1148786 RepID=UPI000158C9B3|nr:hypothetical protein [Geminisphaera colitermitum]